MSCYLRHMKEVLAEAGIELTPANRQQVDRAFHEIAGVTHKDCPAAWKRLKQDYMSDTKKRRELVRRLQAALR